MYNNHLLDNIKIHAFLVAGWSRTQLLGEMAKGSWGLIKMDMNNMINENYGIIIESDRFIYMIMNL